ncbi:PRD domain-containing protein [Paraliobacillus sp. JSM ZJ581]|uniref:PRD domain-containing protein n=1 Tax=Paraliobacillus sp. JSM ZJ581 TaxID=3342118 RepID=UPI0035A8FAEE
MKKKEVNGKLDILLETQTITSQAYQVTNQTFDFMKNSFQCETIKHSEMFWVHMAMALTRIENGETVEGPSNAILQEVYQTPHRKEIEKVISYVSAAINEELPKEERGFFYLHLHGVVENNKQEVSK